jgi:hypothetical protein
VRRRSLVGALLGGVAALAVSAGPVAGAQPVGKVVPRAVGDAGTGLAVVRVLPGERATAVQLGFGVATASANTEAAFSFEKAVAQAAPGAVSVQGNSPEAPGTMRQNAPPDNPQATTGGLKLPATALDALVTGGVLNGSVQARWSDTLGPCVGTISDASTELASLSVLNAIPSLPNVMDLTGRLDAPNLDAQADQTIVDGLKKLAGPLSTLGGVLGGAGSISGSLVSLPNTLSARSVVRLVDMAGTPNKAVQATSTMQVAAVKLLAGTPFEVSVNVVSQPTLQVTSTGNEKTSAVSYTAPVLEVVQGGKSLGRLDAANPKLDIPIAIPLPGVPDAGNLPIIGGLLGSGQPVTDALRKLDLGVIRLSIAELNQQAQKLTTPFPGFQLGATARLLDLQVLPTAALGLANLPSALAQVSLGEQMARAYAPNGGVVCSAPAEVPAAPPAPMPQHKTPGLAMTSVMQYETIPMFWAGTAMLLIGVIMVAALPRRPELVAAEPEADPDTPEPED